jgi:hypothetical protein
VKATKIHGCFRIATFLIAVVVTAGLAARAQVSGGRNSSAGTTTTSVPHLVKFSGTVRDEQGGPRSGIVGITFALYKDQDGGAPLWLETQNVQADASGRYTVMLGATKSDGLPMEFFSSNEARWVGVQPQGQKEQTRALLVSAPYALKAADAETLGGKPLSAFQLVAASANSNSGATQQAQPPAEQLNEIICASKTGCKAAFVPLFTSNGGSAKVSDSIITQTGSTVCRVARLPGCDAARIVTSRTKRSGDTSRRAFSSPGVIPFAVSADVLPDTLQHRFPCEEYLRKLPNHMKNADPDIPILKEAKAEYAKLQ